MIRRLQCYLGRLAAMVPVLDLFPGCQRAYAEQLRDERPRYALLELMGHQRDAGRCEEERIAGTGGLRVTRPDGTQAWYSGRALYRVTWVSEYEARQAAGWTDDHRRPPEPASEFVHDEGGEEPPEESPAVPEPFPVISVWRPCSRCGRVDTVERVEYPNDQWLRCAGDRGGCGITWEIGADIPF